MNKALVAFAAIVAVVLAAGPTRPYPANFVCQEEGDLVVDAENMCWFHKCVATGNEGGLSLIPFRCALGSKNSYNFIQGKGGVCTVNEDAVVGYTCNRTEDSVDGEPPCFQDLVCQNGGTPTYQADKCWCICPLSWQGDRFCDLPTRVDVSELPPQSNICVDGQPQDDYCASSPCKNGGTCFNQCDTFYCLCANHEEFDYTSKMCDI